MTDKRSITSIVLGRRELVITTDGEDFRYLKRNWGDVYLIIRPGHTEDLWRAVARFGNRDELVSHTADGLLDLIRHHYGPSTEGYTEMLMGRIQRKYS